jgi:CRP-like cAMP-binding protein
MISSAILVQNTILFGYLPIEIIQKYIKSKEFNIATYPKSSIVHCEGDLCDKLEIILSGKIVIERIDENGNILAISDFSCNDILGGNLLFSQNPYYPMTVSTKSPSVVLEIEREVLFNLFSAYPTVLRSYLVLISDNAYILGNKIKHYIKKTIRESILSYLKYESKIQNSNVIKLSITKKSLAERMGIARTSLSRELQKMRDDGLIKFDSGTIILLNK